MLKAKIKLILHKLVGFQRFLYYFSIYKIYTLKTDKNENDIFTFIDQVNKSGKDGAILDIGANIGIMTGVIARNTGFKIIAFEPLPLNYTILDKVIARLKIANRVEVHKIALGNSDGFCDMVLPVVDKVRMHGLSHVIDETITEFNDGQTIKKVPLKKLDDVVGNEKIVGIKMDVENFEYQVLLGAESIIKTQKPIIYTELWNNENRMNCFKFIRDLGYYTYYCKNNELIKFDGNVDTVQTFFFIYNVA